MKTPVDCFCFLSPNLSFEHFIPTDELSDGAMPVSNSSVENATRRIPRRNEKNPTQTNTFSTNKASFDRSNHYSEQRDKISNSSLNKFNRKQQRFNSHQYIQQTSIHPSSHLINPRGKSL